MIRSPSKASGCGDEIEHLGTSHEDPTQYLESIGELIGALVEISYFS